MLNIAVLISGGGTNLQAIIDASINKEINGVVKLVISNKKDAYGLERARKYSIEAIYENNEKKIINLLKEKNIELIVLAGYLKIISYNFVNEFRNKIINIHPSLIPSFCGEGYYGKNVHNAVINYGVKITGATVHFVNEKADAGPIIMQKCVEVLENDTVDTLSKKVLGIEHEILKESVKLFCDNKINFQNGRVVISE